MIYAFVEQIQDFLYQGGPVLKAIFLLIFILWGLVFQKLWYLRVGFKKEALGFLKKWKNKVDTSHSLSLRQWRGELSDLHQSLNKGVPFIKTLVALCPLMGLLGTVTGMISVFEVMSVVGTGNARLMASGISMATLPTMAGMVGALSGICMVRFLQTHVKIQKQKMVAQTLSE